MDIKEQINLFNEKFPILMKENNDNNEKIYSLISRKLEEILPIINIMKENNIRFFHPELDVNIYTNHGIILGRQMNKNQLHVFYKKGHINIVNIYNDELEEESIRLYTYAKICDLEFVMKSIEYIKNYLPICLDVQKNINDKNKLFIEKYKTD